MALGLAISGCSPGERPIPPGLTAVSGVIKVDDKPLAGANVMFIPVALGSAANTRTGAGGVTDDSGAYTLQTSSEVPGAAPGEYRVVISRLELPDGSVAVVGEKSPMELQTQGAKEKLHANYSNQASSKLIATIPQGGGKIDFNLKSDGTTVK